MVTKRASALLEKSDYRLLVITAAGVSHSAIYSKADTSKPDVKAIDINQKLAGQSQERGAIPLLYCCTAEELEGMF